MAHECQNAGEPDRADGGFVDRLKADLKERFNELCPDIGGGLHFCGFGAGAGGRGIGGATRLTGAALVDAAAEVGYTKLVRNPGFNSMGEKVFTNGKTFISQDRTQHTGPGWKMFDSDGQRIGTYTLDLTKRIRD